tara:strand:+ start:3461 stop:3826 length:366 start_codon:yes stop_codon:yes gene_type:complete
MNISNYYWYFTSALTPKFCDEVIKYGLSQAESMARTGGYGNKELTKQEVKDMKRKRNSDLVWLNDTWIYKELHPYVHEQIEMQVGILNGIDQNVVSLQNINITNIMIGIVIVGENLMIEKM